MVASVQRAARALGLPPESLDRLERAHRLAMAPRIDRLPDDHHPAYLHPGRTALVLIRDVGTDDAATLAAAMLLESVDESLRIPSSRVESEVGEDVASILDSIPSGVADDRVERLVTAAASTTLVALAERLDHLRHLHMLDDRSGWAEAHAECGQLWLPLAERTHARLATRYRHWHRTFARRLDRA